MTQSITELNSDDENEWFWVNALFPHMANEEQEIERQNAPMLTNFTNRAPNK